MIQQLQTLFIATGRIGTELLDGNTKQILLFPKHLLTCIWVFFVEYLSPLACISQCIIEL